MLNFDVIRTALLYVQFQALDEELFIPIRRREK
jgi:hypothetical protein